MDFDEVFSRSDVQLLLQAFQSMRTDDELRAFIADLCTPRELCDFAQRLLVARLLADGEPYTTVQERTGASSTTVSRVSKALNSGYGGYRLAFERLDKGEGGNGGEDASEGGE